MSAVRIDARTVYVTPLGRRAMLDTAGHGKGAHRWLTFRYVGADATVFGGGFSLSYANARLLRPLEVRHAAAR